MRIKLQVKTSTICLLSAARSVAWLFKSTTFAHEGALTWLEQTSELSK